MKPFFLCQLTGRFYALSINTRIDVDDCIGISSDGILHLSVTKDIYHYLGLEGKLSKTAKKYSNRYSKSSKNIILINYFINKRQENASTKMCKIIENAWT